jgi:HD-GYP domain-containing protein (c-di-GMP phosphodiesterase class II)
VAAAHHERLDGKGYPLGSSEQQIGSETRIITICDFYDALTADRPYRAAMPRDRHWTS